MDTKRKVDDVLTVWNAIRPLAATIGALNRHPIGLKFLLTDDSCRFLSQRDTKCDVDYFLKVGRLLRLRTSTIRAPNRYPISSRLGFIDDSHRFLSPRGTECDVDCSDSWASATASGFDDFSTESVSDRRLMTTKYYVI